MGACESGAGWFWAWALAIPESSGKAEAAKSLLAWATHHTSVEVVTIPEVQGIGTQVGQVAAAAPSGQQTVEAALRSAQAETERTIARRATPNERQVSASGVAAPVSRGGPAVPARRSAAR